MAGHDIKRHSQLTQFVAAANRDPDLQISAGHLLGRLDQSAHGFQEHVRGQQDAYDAQAQADCHDPGQSVFGLADDVQNLVMMQADEDAPDGLIAVLNRLGHLDNIPTPPGSRYRSDTACRVARREWHRDLGHVGMHQDDVAMVHDVGIGDTHRHGSGSPPPGS